MRLCVCVCVWQAAKVMRQTMSLSIPFDLAVFGRVPSMAPQWIAHTSAIVCLFETSEVIRRTTALQTALNHLTTLYVDSNEICYQRHATTESVSSKFPEKCVMHEMVTTQHSSCIRIWINLILQLQRDASLHFRRINELLQTKMSNIRLSSHSLVSVFTLMVNGMLSIEISWNKWCHLTNLFCSLFLAPTQCKFIKMRSKIGIN